MLCVWCACRGADSHCGKSLWGQGLSERGSSSRQGGEGGRGEMDGEEEVAGQGEKWRWPKTPEAPGSPDQRGHGVLTEHPRGGGEACPVTSTSGLLS